MSTTLDEAKESLKRMQEFDASSLSRSDELGTSLSFDDAVEPANRLIGLYRRMSMNALEDVPDVLLGRIKSQADADFSKFQDILDYDPNVQNHTQERTNRITAVTNAYAGAFEKLYPFISYGSSVAVDFQRLENDGRAAVQSIKDRGEEISEELQQVKLDADKILAEVRKVAAEQGVSQQAIFFRDESKMHDGHAENWQVRTLWLSIVLAAYAVASMFFHKIPALQPENAVEAAQLISSKILIFAVLSYLLILSAKNFLSHKHNAIVNKHRQNALMTFTALADAAQSAEGKEIVLTHAASCIFSPQETGYTKPNSRQSDAKPLIELLPRLTSNGST